MDSTLIVDLHAGLKQRLRPEDVAETILSRAPEAFSPEERAVLDVAARGALSRMAEGLSSMAAQFFNAVPPTAQVTTAQGLFRDAPPLSREECADPACLKAFAATISAEIHKAVGASSYETDRLNRAARKARDLDLSRRRYNKLFRFLRRFERKIATYERQLDNVDDQMTSKSGLASRIPLEDLEASPEAAFFVAYYVSRRNRRSVFTNAGQDPAFDEIARMLMDRLKRAPAPAGWRAVAQVMPDREVVDHLSDADKLELLAGWLETLRDIAVRMGEIWSENQFNRKAMVVGKGNNSSAWNALAGAWNIARQGWLAAIEAMGMDDVLDLVCLGKVMRLMAGDVAAWHGQLHPDTAVWAELPPPWEVFLGNATCTRAQVEIACARAGVDPIATAWVAARRARRATPFRPTPELVHGVEVSHPELAVILRKARWFSGQTVRPVPEDLQVEAGLDERRGTLFVSSPKLGLLQRLFGRKAKKPVAD